jgi:hypothetical protein
MMKQEAGSRLIFLVKSGHISTEVYGKLYNIYTFDSCCPHDHSGGPLIENQDSERDPKESTLCSHYENNRHLLHD